MLDLMDQVQYYLYITPTYLIQDFNLILINQALRSFIILIIVIKFTMRIQVHLLFYINPMHPMLTNQLFNLRQQAQQSIPTIRDLALFNLAKLDLKFIIIAKS